MAVSTVLQTDTISIEELRGSLEKISEEHKGKTNPHIMVTGDFNLTKIDWSSTTMGGNCQVIH